jgi:hypothetical protein
MEKTFTAFVKDRWKLFRLTCDKISNLTGAPRSTLQLRITANQWQKSVVTKLCDFLELRFHITDTFDDKFVQITGPADYEGIYSVHEWLPEGQFRQESNQEDDEVLQQEGGGVAAAVSTQMGWLSANIVFPPGTPTEEKERILTAMLALVRSAKSPAKRRRLEWREES